MKLAKPTNPLQESSLDASEREAIALAIELDVELILMDEKQGRQAARETGLRVSGTLGVILDGHRKHMFDGVAALDRLSNSSFYASPELLQAIQRKIESQTT